MYFNRKCKITYICHGATIYSDEFRFSDVENYPPITESGYEEMEKICDYLRKRGVKNDTIYSSPATRCLQSAKLVAKVYKKDFEILENLKPRRCGSFNGKTFEQIERETPDLLERLIYSPEIPTPDDAESMTDFINRVSAEINRVVESNIGNRIIIVTHQDVIKAVICDALNIPHSSLQHIYIKTGSATQISYYESWKSLVYSDYTPL
ncbi:histidine phosphatase family protein [Spirochaetes bacterium]|uniref:Histidine phosphatase family protein n=1 Tax=Candidatus Scatousia excrementipullorum TaxID=2840936 RepID=A0A9D9DPI2_9BACT|nr:histidine phosphatase family protein [Candidatus Scatousia excrementipullorum]